MTQVLPVSSAIQLTELKEVLKKSAGDDGLYDLPDHPKMDYEDIFGEPKSYISLGLGRFIHDGITKVFGGAFNYVQSTIYYILVMITGLFLSFFWGLFFGLVTYLINWFIHPFFKCAYIAMRLASALIRPGIRTFLDPVFEGIGQCFSGIKAAFAVQLRGISVGASSDLSDSPKIMELQEV